MVRVKCLALRSCVALLFAGSACALNAQTLAIPEGLGCANWPAVREDISGKIMLRSFISGMAIQYWIDHEGTVGKPRIDPLAELGNASEMFTWVNAYCAASPKEQLVTAMVALFAELKARQVKRVSSQ